MLGLSQGSVSYIEQGKTDEAQAEKALQFIAEVAAEKAEKAAGDA